MTSFRRRIFQALAFALAVVLVFAAVPYNYIKYNAATDTSAGTEKALEEKISLLQDEQKELKSKISNTEGDIESYKEKKQYIDELIKSTQNEIHTATTLIAERTKNIEDKKKEIADLEVVVDEKYALMMEWLRFTYEEGTASYLELVLEAENMSDFLMTVERVGSMLDFDRTLMSDLNAAMATLKQQQSALEKEKKKQEEMQQQLVAKRADLEKQVSETEQILSQLQSDQAAYEKALRVAEAEEKKLNSQIEKLLAERQRQTNAIYTGGAFIWPVNSKNVSSPYGYRRWSSGYTEFHLGIDIPVPFGSNVFASNSGTVITATYHYSYGYYIVIDHGGGYATLYAHNSQLLVSAGDKVKQGDVIAKAGATGNAYGSHCHFEVRINGATVNPLSHLS